MGTQSSRVVSNDILLPDSQPQAVQTVTHHFPSSSSCEDTIVGVSPPLLELPRPSTNKRVHGIAETPRRTASSTGLMEQTPQHYTEGLNACAESEVDGAPSLIAPEFGTPAFFEWLNRSMGKLDSALAVVPSEAMEKTAQQVLGKRKRRSTAQTATALSSASTPVSGPVAKRTARVSSKRAAVTPRERSQRVLDVLVLVAQYVDKHLSRETDGKRRRKARKSKDKLRPTQPIVEPLLRVAVEDINVEQEKAPMATASAAVEKLQPLQKAKAAHTTDEESAATSFSSHLDNTVGKRQRSSQGSRVTAFASSPPTTPESGTGPGAADDSEEDVTAAIDFLAPLDEATTHSRRSTRSLGKRKAVVAEEDTVEVERSRVLTPSSIETPPRRTRQQTGATSRHFKKEPAVLQRARTPRQRPERPPRPLGKACRPCRSQHKRCTHREENRLPSPSVISIIMKHVRDGFELIQDRKRLILPNHESSFSDISSTPSSPGSNLYTTTRTAATTATPRKRRIPAGVSCIPFPPISAAKFGLAQERYADDPYKLLIAVIFLNRTKGMHAMPIFRNLMESYPTPEALAAADFNDVVDIIETLGLQNQRANTFINFAKLWLEDPPARGRRWRTLHYPKKGDGKEIQKSEDPIGDDKDDLRTGAFEVSHLPGIGAYAMDSWRIFCRDKLRGVAEGYDGEGTEMEFEFEPEWKRVVPLDKELRAYLRWKWLKEGWVWNPENGNKVRASKEVMEKAKKGELGERADADEEEEHLVVLEKKKRKRNRRT